MMKRKDGQIRINNRPRDEIEVKMQILSVCKEERIISYISRVSNVSHYDATGKVQSLIRCKLLQRLDNGSTTFKITGKGYAALMTYNNLKEFLRDGV